MTVVLPAFFVSCKSASVIPPPLSHAAAYTLTLPGTSRNYSPGKLFLERSGDGALIESSVNRENRFYFKNLRAGNYSPAYAVTEERTSAGEVRYVYIFSQMSAIHGSITVENKNVYGGTIFVRASRYRAEEADPFQRAVMKKISVFSQTPELDEISGKVYYYSITESTVDISDKERRDFLLYVKDDLGQDIPF